jgi:hypothetical protein
VRTLIDLVARIPNTINLQIELCQESIEWAKGEQRTFLRQRIEARLASLYLHSPFVCSVARLFLLFIHLFIIHYYYYWCLTRGSADRYLETDGYTQALRLLTTLLREVKRFDDKPLLVEIQLTESKVQHKLRNLSKSRASLTAARTAANAIYCPPLLQAEIDTMSGTLHAEEKDYKTAYSYFYEAFEGYNSITAESAFVARGAISALKYMLLCKIMLNSVSDVNQIISGKMGLKYAGTEMEAMRAVANAHKQRSLQAFSEAKTTYANGTVRRVLCVCRSPPKLCLVFFFCLFVVFCFVLYCFLFCTVLFFAWGVAVLTSPGWHRTTELTKDPIIDTHLSELEDTLLEQNLCRIIEPFSCVEIAHVAKIIDLPIHSVEKKYAAHIIWTLPSGHNRPYDEA